MVDMAAARNDRRVSFISFYKCLIQTKQVTSANAQLKEGDIVTVRGKGRLEINAVEKTSKDKFRVKMVKYA